MTRRPEALFFKSAILARPLCPQACCSRAPPSSAPGGGKGGGAESERVAVPRGRPAWSGPKSDAHDRKGAGPRARPALRQGEGAAGTGAPERQWQKRRVRWLGVGATCCSPGFISVSS